MCDAGAVPYLNRRTPVEALRAAIRACVRLDTQAPRLCRPTSDRR